jgi:hypothetical protein
MSLARIYTTTKVRKDWTCDKCGAAIKKGVDGRISFAVGFRGFERTRCLKPECFPSRSERESSAVATIYDVQDSADIASCGSLEDLESVRDEIVAACEEVADEYESNEMYEINYDLQERAEQIRGAGDELSSWQPESDEPEQDDDAPGEDLETEEWLEWLEEAKTSLQDAINDMDLP